MFDDLPLFDTLLIWQPPPSVGDPVASNVIHKMTRALNHLLVTCALVCASCSQRSEPEYFTSYQEAKEFCDAAARAKDLSGIIEYADLSGVPEIQLKQFKERLNNFESAITKKTLEKTLELSPEEHEQFLKDEFAKQTPAMQKLTGPWPVTKWNIMPDKYLVYVFALRQTNGDYSEFKLTFGLNHRSKGWVIVCSY